MFFIALLLFSALAVSSVAGYFSIVGLMAIFPAASTEILAMGVVLEVAKLVTASWVYRYWHVGYKGLKSYFIAAVVVLSIVTSMGIFGFLSKAHLEHSVTVGDNTLQIERLDRQIASEQRRINDAQTVLDQLDETVQTLIDYDRIRGEDGAVATRERQSEERQELNGAIDSAQTQIDGINERKLVLEQEQLAVEVEVGPILYIAELFYGNSEKETIDKAVRFMILLLICVFDPLAILLVIATNISLKERRGESITFVDNNVVKKPVDFGLPEASEPPPMPEVPPAKDSEVEIDENSPEFNQAEKDYVLRTVDRRLRKKLGWLIDQKGENNESES